MQAAAPKFSELGDQRLFKVLIFEVFNAGVPVLAVDARKYANASVWGCAHTVNPTLDFLGWLGFLENTGQYYSPTGVLSEFVSIGQEDACIRLAKLLFDKLKSNQQMALAFSDGAITQEPETGAIYLASSKISSAWLGLLVLLRNLSVLHEGPTGTGLFRMDESISASFIDSALAAQKAFLPKLGGFSLERLKALQQLQQEQGAKAEVYVVKYERARLKAHKYVSQVECISEKHVGAGFDILSFETEKSLVHDRFIEVKSFKNYPRFFWSRNEYEVAKERGSSYFIYLVEIGSIDDPNYNPIILRNPATLSDTESEWSMIPDSWLVQQRKSAT